jgi:flagellar biosynthesis protein FlhG
VVRRDERVRDAIRHQTPLMMRHPNCSAAEDVEAIVSGLLAVPRAGRPKV